MNDLNRLPEITEQALAGLKADENLKHRILVAAANSGSPSADRFRSRRSLVALLALSAVLILSVIGIGRLSAREESDPAAMHAIPAGSHRNASPVHLQVVIDEVAENNQDLPVESQSPEPAGDETGL